MRLGLTYADWGCRQHWCADYCHCNLGIIDKWVAVQKFKEEIGLKITKIPYEFFNPFKKVVTKENSLKTRLK